MVNVEHGSLRAFKHHGFSRSDGLVDQQGGVSNEWSDLPGSARVFVVHAVQPLAKVLGQIILNVGMHDVMLGGLLAHLGRRADG